MNNDELIITNELQENNGGGHGAKDSSPQLTYAVEDDTQKDTAREAQEGEKPARKNSRGRKAETAEEPDTTENLNDEAENRDSATTRNAEEEQDQSFREALREQIHEEEMPLTQKLSVIKILGGDFFTSQILRRQIWLMILIFVFVIMYVSNRYSCQKSMLEIDKLQTELQDAKYKALSTSSSLTERSRQSRVLDMLKENKDSVLHIATQPPYIIKVPEE